MLRIFRVSGVKKETRSLILSVSLASWMRYFESLEVTFEARTHNHGLDKHNQLGKRQNAPASTSASPIDFPPAPTSTPTNTNIQNANINQQYIDTTIFPPSFPAAESVGLEIPLIPEGYVFKCKNCTIQGNVDISHGTFSSNNTESIINFANHGFVELEPNNFFAHIELETSVQGSADLLHYPYTLPIPDIGIPGFAIPGIAEVGPVLCPRVTLGAQLAAELDFTYGFNLSVPEQSAIFLDIGNVTNSSMASLILKSPPSPSTPKSTPSPSYYLLHSSPSFSCSSPCSTMLAPSVPVPSSTSPK